MQNHHAKCPRDQIQPNSFIKGSAVYGFCNERQAIQELYEGLLNIGRVGYEFNDYDLNNLKSQLLKPGAMSSKYFQKWAEVLDIDVEVIVRDKPGFEKLRDEITIILK